MFSQAMGISNTLLSNINQTGLPYEFFNHVGNAPYTLGPSGCPKNSFALSKTKVWDACLNSPDLFWRVLTASDWSLAIISTLWFADLSAKYATVDTQSEN